MSGGPPSRTYSTVEAPDVTVHVTGPDRVGNRSVSIVIDGEEATRMQGSPSRLHVGYGPDALDSGAALDAVKIFSRQIGDNPGKAYAGIWGRWHYASERVHSILGHLTRVVANSKGRS